MEGPDKKSPLVSVIIPLYNKEPYVERALRSVLMQSIQTFEIIVVEGGSTDNSLEKVQGFDDPRITVVQQREKGVSAARNEGVQAARSEFLAFLDADDEWIPGFIETMIRLQDNYPHAGAYFTAVKEHGLHNEEKNHRYSFVPSEGWEGLVDNYFQALIQGDPLYYPSSLALHKRVFLEHGGFPVGAAWGEDQDLCGRIALRNPVAFSSHICSIIHKTDEYAVSMRKRIALTEEHPFIRTARRAFENGDVPDHLVRDLKRWTEYLVIFSVKYNLNAGNPAAARNVLKRNPFEGFFAKKLWLEFWSFMPVWTFHIRGYSLFGLCDSCILFIKRSIQSVVT